MSIINHLWFIFILYTNALEDGPFEASQSKLSIPLYNHISSIFNNQLHIIGGLTQENIPNHIVYSTSPVSIDDFLHNATTNISFNSKSNTMPDFWSSSISCDYQCHVTINNNIYIVQSDSSNIPYLIIYDMNTESYTSSANYPYDITSYVSNDYGRYIFMNGCVASDGHYIWFVGSSTIQQMNNFFQNTIIYDTITQQWNGSIDIYQILRNRKGTACQIDGDYLYMFGGEAEGVELTLIDKCYIKDNSVFFATADCQVLDATLKYHRSHFHLSSVTFLSSDFAILYGGQTTEAQQHAEIFYFQTEAILISIDVPFNIPFTNYYGSIVLNNYFVLTGGNEIVYADIASFFEDYNHHTPFNFSCVTYINATFGNPKNVYPYLLNNNNGELIFEITTFYEINEAFDFDFDGGWFSGRAMESGILYFRSNDRRKMTLSMAPALAADVNMETLSVLTNIDMMNSSLRYVVFWMKWSPKMDDSGNAVSMPFFRIGVGDVVDMFSMSSYPSKTLSMSDAFPEDIYMPYMKSLVLKYCKAIFYTDTCSLSVNFISSFIVGEYLSVDWNLTEATSLIVPIYITSINMIGIDHVMHVLDRENHQCILCRNGNDTSCYPCDEGIQIVDLSTYDIHQNHYEIYVSSQLSNLNIIQNDEIQGFAAFKRIVMMVEIVIDIADINDTNETLGFYPDGEIYITPVMNNTNATQPNGTVIIHFDDDLSFESDAEMFMDFYTGDCIITLDEDTTNCSDPLIVPRSMILKPISENTYDISVESDDVQLLGKTSYSFPRKIQTISVQFSDSVYFGQVIDLFVDMMDDEVYQSLSEINVLNEKYSVQKIISLVMNYDSGGLWIEQCNIRTPLAHTIEACDDGIEFASTNATDIDHHIYLTLSSTDTYLSSHESRILIKHCPKGQGLIGGGQSSYSCSPCSGNQVGVLTDSVCVSCDDIPGIACFGSTNLVVDYNYWLAINDASNNNIFDGIYQEQVIITKFCPSGFCCQDVSGCNYNQTTQLCATNRDPNSPLCGSCMNGYSEVFASMSCKKCEKNNAAWYLLIVFVIALFAVLVLIFVDNPVKSETVQEANYAKLLVVDDLQSLKTSYFRPLLYFFQSIALITISKGFIFYLTPIIELLSFDFLLESSDEDAGICFIPNMKSIDKELWFLVFPLFMFLCLGMLALVKRFVLKERLKRLEFGWNLVFGVYLILVGKIISTMLKVTACSTIGAASVHFYGGYLECYGIYWKLAMVMVIILIVLWGIIWVLLYRMDSKQRDSRQSYLRKITKPYRKEFWFWEIVLISRRILLAFLVTFQYFDDNVIQYILLILLLIYFSLQSYFKPFNHQRVNTMEFICMLMLIIALATIIFDFKEEYLQFIMSVVVLVPISLFIIYIGLVIKHSVKNKKNLNANSDSTKRRLSNMIHRMTHSEQMLFSNTSTANDTQQNDDKNVDIEMLEVMSDTAMDNETQLASPKEPTNTQEATVTKKRKGSKETMKNEPNKKNTKKAKKYKNAKKSIKKDDKTSRTTSTKKGKPADDKGGTKPGKPKGRKRKKEINKTADSNDHEKHPRSTSAKRVRNDSTASSAKSNRTKTANKGQKRKDTKHKNETK